jgi:hypothetical protein
MISLDFSGQTSILDVGTLRHHHLSGMIEYEKEATSVVDFMGDASNFLAGGDASFLI